MEIYIYIYMFTACILYSTQHIQYIVQVKMSPPSATNVKLSRQMKNKSLLVSIHKSNN